MKVETFKMGPVTMRNLSCDTMEAIALVVTEHWKTGWQAGVVYPTGCKGQGYVSMFKWRENEKPLNNPLKII